METATLEPHVHDWRGLYWLEISSTTGRQMVPLPWNSEITVGSETTNDVVVNDPTVSRRHCSFARTSTGVLFVRDHHSRNGVYVGGARVESAELVGGMAVMLGSTSVVIHHTPAQEQDMERMSTLPGMVGKSPVMRALSRRVRRVARVPVPVLIQGETGTGKELVARAIHELSPRKGGPFIALNAGALAEQLVASELFGHVSGSFTGATANKTGAFEAADGGTLFLDEVGELSKSSQVHLLRVLEQGRIRRVGSVHEKRVNVRVIAATWRLLPELVSAGTFRADLLHRLSVGTVHVPPLSERKSDIPLLAEFFLAQMAPQLGTKKLRSSALAALTSRVWPGNVRELRNVVIRAALFSDDEWLGPDDLLEKEPWLETQGLKLSPHAARRVVEAHDGNISAAAKSCGVPRSTFRGWLSGQQ